MNKCDNTGPYTTDCENNGKSAACAAHDGVQDERVPDCFLAREDEAGHDRSGEVQGNQMSEEGQPQNSSNGQENKSKRRWLWVLLILTLLLAVGAFWTINKQQNDPQRLYAAAVADAVAADEAEIMPLVELTTNSPMTTWDQQGRVLLLSWHRHPERYPSGDQITLTDGAVWTFTDKEIAAWYQNNKGGVTDWDLRLEQLIGLPPEAGYTHMSGFWARPEDVCRPAYVPDITEQMQNVFAGDVSSDFVAWFEENSKFSYEESAYPWTRLGYTYDWANNGTEYGLTEFFIDENAPVEIAFTKTTTEFINWLEQGASLNETASRAAV